MMNERKWKGLIVSLIGIMVFLAAASGMVYADRDETKAPSGEETVYVITDSEGKEEQRIVSEKGELHYDGYEAGKLPVTMEVSYKLNGKEIKPEKLTGKRGRVEIKLNYTNHEKRGDVYVPFLVVSGMVLDEEHFSNVEIDNGKTVGDGSRVIAVGYALPGVSESMGSCELSIPESVTITADVKDFQMETIYTLMTPEAFEEFETAETGDLKDLTENLSKLTSGVDRLVSGTDTLNKGTAKLKDGADKLTKGAGTLSGGAETLYGGTEELVQGAEKLTAGTDSLMQGAETFAAGNDELSKGVETLYGGLSQLSANSAAINGGARQLADSVFQSANNSLAAAGMQVNLTADNYKQVLQQAASANPAAAQQLQAIQGQLEQVMEFSQGVAAYTAGVDNAAAGAAQISENIGKLSAGARQLYEGAAALQQGQNQVLGGIKELSGGAKALSQGAGELEIREAQLAAGISDLGKGAEKLNQGVREMAEEVSAQLAGLPTGDLEKALNRIEQMKNAAQSYNSFTGTKKYDSVKFVFKTKEISDEKEQ